jgi:hypothetical protein
MQKKLKIRDHPARVTRSNTGRATRPYPYQPSSWQLHQSFTRPQHLPNKERANLTKQLQKGG